MKSLSSPTLTTQIKQFNHVVSPAELIRPSPLLSAALTAARYAKAISNEPKDPGNSPVIKIKSSYPVPMISPALIHQPRVASTTTSSTLNEKKGSTKSGSFTVAAPAEFAFPVSSYGSSTAAVSAASIISQQKPNTVKDVAAHSGTDVAGVSSSTASSRPAGLTEAPTVPKIATQRFSQAVLEKSKDQLRNTSDTPKNTTATASPNTPTGLSETEASRGNTPKISGKRHVTYLICVLLYIYIYLILATKPAEKVNPTASIEPTGQEATRSAPSVQAKKEAAGAVNLVKAPPPNSARAVAGGAGAASFTYLISGKQQHVNYLICVLLDSDVTNIFLILATKSAGKVRPTASFEPPGQEATRSVPISVQAKVEAAGAVNLANAPPVNSARAVAGGAGAASFTPYQMELIWKLQQINHNFMSRPASSQATHEEELVLANDREAARYVDDSCPLIVRIL